MHGKGRHDPLRGVDRAIGRLAESQHGVVSRTQLLELAVGPGAIEHRINEGRLRPVYRGVYAVVGLRLMTRRSHWMAAVLTYGAGAFLSYRAGAALWGVRGGSRVEVTVPRGRKPREGIQVHWANLPADEVTAHHGIPVTGIARTLLDLSAVVQRDELRAAFRQAEQLRLTDALGIKTLIERYPRKPGLPTLKAVFEEAQRGLGIVKSVLEERFQAFLVNAGLPNPKTNVLIEDLEVDCAWPEDRLVVELDSRAWHDTELAFEEDRARDRRLGVAGWRIVRVTWRQLTEHPEELEADLRRLLGLSPRRTRGSRRTRAASTLG
jgi:very-short-patch-repair endonuclease